MIALDQTLDSVDSVAVARLRRSLQMRRSHARTRRLVSHGRPSALVDKQRRKVMPNNSATSNLVVSLKRC